jgi:cytochrome c
MRTRWVVTLGGALIAAGLLLQGSVAQAEDSPGAKLYQEKACHTCHGPDGKTTLLPVYPKIAGQNADYIKQQMTDIKSGARSNGQAAAMKGIMATVTDEEIKVLAAYVASLPH